MGYMLSQGQSMQRVVVSDQPHQVALHALYFVSEGMRGNHAIIYSSLACDLISRSIFGPVHTMVQGSLRDWHGVDKANWGKLRYCCCGCVNSRGSLRGQEIQQTVKQFHIIVSMSEYHRNMCLACRSAYQCMTVTSRQMVWSCL